MSKSLWTLWSKFTGRALLALALGSCLSLAHAAVELNRATQAELETVKGIGPAMSGKILAERKKGEFKNWDEFISRVSGVGPGNAAKFSGAGLTVQGAAFNGAVAQAGDAGSQKKKDKADKPK